MDTSVIFKRVWQLYWRFINIAAYYMIKRIISTAMYLWTIFNVIQAENTISTEQ